MAWTPNWAQKSEKGSYTSLLPHVLLEEVVGGRRLMIAMVYEQKHSKLQFEEYLRRYMILLPYCEYMYIQYVYIYIYTHVWGCWTAILVTTASTAPVSEAGSGWAACMLGCLHQKVVKNGWDCQPPIQIPEKIPFPNMKNPTPSNKYST